METHAQRYKTTDLYRTLVSTQQYTPASKHEEFRFIPNHSKVGGTWDAKHLDKFIDTKWGSGRTSILASRQSDMPLENQGTQSVKNLTQKTGNSRPLTTQGSHFFRQGPRFGPEREKAYLINLARDFTIKEAKLNTNSLVTNSHQSQDNLVRFCNKELTISEKGFDTTQLNFPPRLNSLVSPQESRRQLRDLKSNQVEQANYKKKKMELTKKYRIYKKGFRSGILGIDNPLNDDTLLYKEEHDNLAKKKQDIHQIEQRRFQQLDSFTGTNSIIEFFNRKYDKTTSLPPPKVIDKNVRQKVDMEHTVRWQDSRERLFGNPPVHFNVGRAIYLKNQESKGKKWDIISSADTTLALKSFRDNL